MINIYIHICNREFISYLESTFFIFYFFRVKNYSKSIVKKLYNYNKKLKN